MISVVIPNLNDKRIINAISTIISSKAIAEVLIVDGKTTNEEVLEFYKNLPDARVKILKYEDKGIFDAINYGVSQAKGEIIYLQGSDDIVSDSVVFDTAVDFLQNNANYQGYCMGCKFVDTQGGVTREWFPKSVTRNKILLGILPPHFSLFLRKEVYLKTGGFEISEGGDLSLDSLWLIKMGVLFEGLKIFTDHKYWLNMELGGLSTGSLKIVFRQNFKLFHLLKEKSWRPKGWFILPLVKVLSKFHQVNIMKKLKLSN